MAFQKMHYALQNATHDSSLHFNKDILSEGRVEFIKVAAYDTFKSTIVNNLPFDDSLKSEDTSLYAQSLTVVLERYIDSIYIDPETRNKVVYPYNIKFVTQSGKTFERIIFAPSVVMIVKTTVQGNEKPTEFLSISEYKGFK